MAITAPQNLTKQPSEKRQYSMDFANLLATGETLTLTSVTSELRGGGTSDLTITSETVSGQTITMFITGGTHSQVYRVTVLVSTNGNQILEGDGILKISNKN